jgi:hypothetical protein
LENEAGVLKHSVMPGLVVPGIHVLATHRREERRIAGSSPAMTEFLSVLRSNRLLKKSSTVAR